MTEFILFCTVSSDSVSSLEYDLYDCKSTREDLEELK